MTGVARERGTPLRGHRQPYAVTVSGTAAVMPRPRQPDPSSPPPIWICPSCQKLMRLREIEVANGEEQIKLTCAACGMEAVQTNALSE
jgi:hypothetical protein